MSENKNSLSDKSIIPSDELLHSIVGDNLILWQELITKAKMEYEGAEGVWNYYNDGKQWLYKFIRKKKTLFWSGIIENKMRVTFYFSDKAEPLIGNSDLPEKLKTDFQVSKKYGSIRGLSITMTDEKDVENAIQLLGIKSRLK